MIKGIIGIICLLIIFVQYKKEKLISSVSIFSLCYFLIFVLYPSSFEHSFTNERLIDICALIGIISYSIGIFLGSRIKTKKKNVKENFPPFYLSMILFVLCFITSLLIVYITYGSSTISNLINGTITSREVSQTMKNANILSFSQHTMIPCILCMWISAKEKKQKIIRLICMGLYTIESFIFSFTRIFLASVFVMIFFYEMRKVSKKKQVIYSIIGVLSLIVLLIMMNYIRCLGLSYEMSLHTLLNPDVIFESTDFSASYNMLNTLLNYPSPHISILVYLKPLFVFIPRTIWMNKPESLNVQVMKYVNPSAAARGLSSGISILGEGYAVMGYFGMFFACFIWGLICSNMDKKYYERLENNTILSIKNIYYYIFAVFIVISAQRGDWSVYLSTIIFFYFLPVYILSRIKYKERKK